MNLNTNIRSDWSTVKLGEICEKAAKIKRKEVNPDKELIYLDIGGIDNRSNRIINYKKYQWKDAPSRAQQIVKVGDTLFSTVRTYLKNIAMVNNSEFENQICSSGFTVIRSINELADSKYLFAISLSEGFLGPLNKLQTGTSYPAVRDRDVFDQTIPLPPLLEQQALVSKIEQLFSDLDNGIDNFKKAQELLKIYRQAVLKNACEGKLVPNEAELARSEGRDYEPADVLLARILKERREKWNGKGKYKEPEAPDTNGLLELPEGWIWSIFGLVFNVYVGATPSRKRQDYWGGQIPWVSSGEVGFCKIFQTKETITDMGLTNSSTAIHPPGTVLLGMIGEGKTRGQAAILKIAACNNQNSAAIRVSEIGLPPEYIFYFLEGAYEHTRTIGSGNNQQALNKSRVQSMFFPLPPLAEQRRIVTEVERRLSICDNMETTIAESLQKAESLRQSILKRAFEGKLLNEKELEEVRNAPDWEPAEKLLERIKAEKTNMKAQKKGKK